MVEYIVSSQVLLLALRADNAFVMTVAISMDTD